MKEIIVTLPIFPHTSCRVAAVAEREALCAALCLTECFVWKKIRVFDLIACPAITLYVWG